MAHTYKKTGFKRREREEDEVVDLGDEVVFKHETAKAILVEIDGDETWIPKSVVRAGSTVLDCQKGEKGTLILPQWFARKERLVD